MDRTDEYLNTHPHARKLFDLIGTMKKFDKVNIKITTGSPRCKVINTLETPQCDIAYFTVNNIGNPFLLIRGRKTFSFDINSMKIHSIEPDIGVDKTDYTVKFSHCGDEYELCFHLM